MSKMITKEYAALICIHLEKLEWNMPEWNREMDINRLITTYDKDLEVWISNLRWTDLDFDSISDFKKALFNIDLEKIIKDNE